MKLSPTVRFLCLLSALLLLLGLSACGTAPAEPSSGGSTEPPTASTAPAPEQPLPGLHPVPELTLLPNESVYCLCRDSDGAAALLTRWDDSDSLWKNRLLLLDPKTASVTACTELEPYDDDFNFSRLELTGQEILCVDEYGERAIVFDRSGRLSGQRDYPVMSRENLGWQNGLLTDETLHKEQRWAEFSRDEGEPIRAAAFYDEPDRLHLLDEPYDRILDASGRRLLTVQNLDNGMQQLAMLDLEQSLCLGRITLRVEDWPGAEWITVGSSLLGDGWALTCLNWDGTQAGSALCFWYPDTENASPLGNEVLTGQLLQSRIEALSRELEQAGMIFHLDEAPDSALTPTTGLSVLENTCETGASLFGQYWILSRLAGFVHKLPSGMVRETTSGFPGGDTPDLDGLHIYIVRNIPGDAAGFACTWTEPMLICFATEEFGEGHLAHEFMHILDFRLARYKESVHRNFEEEWSDLSPYYAYDSDLTPEQQNELEAYFVSYYAMTNYAEDRAETFQRLFDETEPPEDAWWYKDRPGVRAKVAYLIKNLRAAFPSVQAVDSAWWEKLAPEP